MDEFVKLLLAVFGANAVFVLALGFVLYLVLKHKLNQNLEKVRSNLKIDEITHRIRYGNVYQKIAETIAECYTMLVSVERDFRKLLSHATTPTRELAGLADQSLTQFREWFNLHQIYLPEDICKKIESLVDKHIDVLVRTEVSVCRMGKINGDTNAEMSDKEFEDLIEMRKKFREDAIPLLDDLKKEFRKKIGVSNNPTVTKFSN